MKKIGFLLVLLLLIISTVFASAGAEEKAELQITVMLGDTDVSQKAQVMLLQGYIPIGINPGQDKVLTLEAGTYQITALLPGSKGISPAGGEVTLEPCEVKKITLNLQNMPGTSSEQLPDIGGMMSEEDEDKFDPNKATDAELREVLESEDEEERKAAFNELYARQKDSFLREMLSHAKGELRNLSLERLYNLTAEAKIGHPNEAIPIEDNRSAIIECLQDSYLPARIKAIQIMGNYPEFPAEVMPELIEALQDPEVDVRYAAVTTIGHGSGSEGIAEEEVIEALATRVEKDEEARVRRGAIYSLRRTIDSRVYKVLVIALADKDLEVRRTSAKVLGEFGATTEILTDITAALTDPDYQVKVNLLRAIQQLESTELAGVIHPVAELLADDDKYVREEAIGVIRAAGSAGAEVLPALVEALSDKSLRVVREAAWTLDALGPEHAGKALPELLEWLKVETSEFGSLSSQSDTISPIAGAIVTIGEPAIPGLTELLSHHLVETRARSAGILGRIGPAAEGAVPKLRELLDDESENDAVRKQAYQALEHITGEKPEL